MSESTGVLKDNAAKKARILRRILGDDEAEKLGLVPESSKEPQKLSDEASKYQQLFDETKKTNPDWIYVELSDRKVFRTIDSVIKFGPGIDPREAKTMQFIRQATTIPVPEARDDGPDVLITSYVEGDNLRDCWKDLSSDKQKILAEQMRSILQQLRAVKGNYIGGVDRGPAIDRRRGDRVGGPFESEGEFNDFLLASMSPGSPMLHREAMQQAMEKRYEIVFSHADLNLHNIIVKAGKIVALVDWETAGWYPEYWEYVKFCWASAHEKTWHKWGHTIFPTAYPEELVRDAYYGLFVF